MKNRPWELLFFLLFVLSGCSNKQETQSINVSGVENPVILLNGTWKFSPEPAEDFWSSDQDLSTWADIQVPGECQMQGFPIKLDKPFVYKLKFKIPDDYKENKIFLNFHGVYSYARVWVNGQFLREHFGGFTKWNCDITDHVSSGDSATLTVEVTDRADDISYASGYSKHQIGGILRDVELVALPQQYFKTLWFETNLDEEFHNAEIKVFYELTQNTPSKIRIELFDELKKRIQHFEWDVDSIKGEMVIMVENPKKWDAEHPNLYTTVTTLIENGKEIMSTTRSIGFREVVVDGNRLLVNGRPVKLRGVNRHDVHPLLGRVSAHEYELKDVKLAKEANVNFIRTSHYPPTESFLELCDEYGIYVEDETAVCFVDFPRSEQYLPSDTQNDENFTHRYLSQITEMVMNHRNHPSVIIWSIGNESSYGINFQQSYDWIKENDKTRPVIFSYPKLVPDSMKAYDIMSVHYPDLTGTKEQYEEKTKSFGFETMPVLFDEWIHVSCYNNLTLKEDPNVRDFWGISLDSAWQRTFEETGGLGGAIWGYIDEIFMLPPELQGFNQWWGIIDKVNLGGEFVGPTVGYGEWGIIDVWRRKKPEFWNVKKAYSPIRILKTIYESHTGQTITIPVKNRFDHTNLNEITAFYTYNGIKETLTLPSIEPHSDGEITIKMEKWDATEPILIDFMNSNGEIIDSYNISLNSEVENQNSSSRGKAEHMDEDTFAIVRCENGTEFQIDKKTGLFTRLTIKNEQINFSGPYLNCRLLGKELKFTSHLMDQYGIEWKLKSVSFEIKDDKVIVSSTGDYSKLKDVEFITEIYGDGSVSVNYSVNNVPEGLIREMGVMFLLEDVFDSLVWKRKPYWSYYPEGHLSAVEGATPLFPSIYNNYRQAPEKPWEHDSKSFYYDGISDESGHELTYVAKATKENVMEYELRSKNKGILKVLSTGNPSCRIDKEKDQIALYINNKVDYPDLGWGNYQRNIPAGGKHTGRIYFEVGD